MSSTPRLSLPLLSAGQAQKEIFHNESLQILDVVSAPAVEELPRASPPAAPAVGESYIVDDSPTDGWAGMPHCVAAWTSGGWRFIQPLEGMAFYVRSNGNWAVFRSGAWELGLLRGDAVIVAGLQVVGPRLPAIASAIDGTTVDVEARAVVGQILDALRGHGLIET